MERSFPLEPNPNGMKLYRIYRYRTDFGERPYTWYGFLQEGYIHWYWPYGVWERTKFTDDWKLCEEYPEMTQDELETIVKINNMLLK